MLPLPSNCKSSKYSINSASGLSSAKRASSRFKKSLSLSAISVLLFNGVFAAEVTFPSSPSDKATAIGPVTYDKLYDIAGSSQDDSFIVSGTFNPPSSNSLLVGTLAKSSDVFLTLGAGTTIQRPQNFNPSLSPQDNAKVGVVTAINLDSQGSANNNRLTVEGNGKNYLGVTNFYGAYAANSVENNSVTISSGVNLFNIKDGEGTTDGQPNSNYAYDRNKIHGAYSESGDAFNNHVFIERGAFAERAVGASAYGDENSFVRDNTVVIRGELAYAQGAATSKGIAKKNRVVVESGGRLFRRGIGGLTGSGQAADNIVEVQEGAIINGNLYGGRATEVTGTASGNRVEFRGAYEDKASNRLYGATTVGGLAMWNEVNIFNVGQNASLDAWGAQSNSGSVQGNFIFTENASGDISNFSVGSLVGGETVSGEASRNYVTVSSFVRVNESAIGGKTSGASAVSNRVYVYGKSSFAKNVTGGISDSADDSHGAFHNTVYLNSGSESETVVGGQTTKSGRAEFNEVHVYNSTVSKKVTGGSGAGGAAFNMVELQGWEATAKAERATGAEASSGDLQENSVNLFGKSEITSAFGAYSDDSVNAFNNRVFAHGESASVGSAVGARSRGNVQNNKVILAGKSNAVTVVGGVSLADAANSNSVDINEASHAGTAVGGYSEGHCAQENVIDLRNNSKAENLYGGYVKGNGVAVRNQVHVASNTDITGAFSEISGEITGGYSSQGTAYKNYVNVYQARIGNTFGGKGKSSGDNTVLLESAIVNGSVFGGYAENAYRTENNLVQVNGTSEIKGNVVGAFISDSSLGAPVNNSVSLNGLVTVEGTVYGAATGAFDSLRELNGGGNTLVFGGRVRAGGVGGLDNLHFLLTDANKLSGTNDEYILTITGDRDVNLIGKDIHVYDRDTHIEKFTAEKYGLIKVAAAPARGSSGSLPVIKMDTEVNLYQTFTDTKWQVVNDHVGELYITGKPSGGNDLVVKPNPPVTETPGPGNNPGNEGSPETGDEPGTEVIPGVTTANKNSETLSENRLASVALVNKGASFVADAGISAMKDQMYGKHWFFAGEGGTNRFGKGAHHFDLNGGSVITGAMNSVSGTLVGGFFEASWGHAASRQTGASAKSNLQSYGVGILASRDVGMNTTVDGSLRLGWYSNSFKGRYFDVDGRADFKTRSLYSSLHLGAKQTFTISDAFSMDAYGRYVLSVIGSDSVSTGDAEKDKYKAKTTVSHTLRAGVKAHANLNDSFRLTAGVAVEETLGATAKGRISGYGLRNLNINGTTGVGELSLKAKPSKASPWEFDLGVNGYVGVRRGVTGNARATYRF